MMKLSLVAFLISLTTSGAYSASLTWDTVANGTTINHANGTWDLAGTVWNDGAGNNVAWSNTPLKDAVFAGNTTGVTTITVGSSLVAADNITVNGNGGTMQISGTYANLSANKLTVQTGGAGKLAFNTPATLGNVSAISIANGATLLCYAGATITSAMDVTGSGNTENLGALRIESNSKLQGTINLLGDSTFGSNSATGIFDSIVSGNFAFNQAAAGAGSVQINGNNTFIGGTTISRNTVEAGHNNAFGSGTLRLNGGTLSSSSTTARTFSNTVAMGASVTLGNTTNSGKLSFPNGPFQSTTASTSVTTNSTVEIADLRVTGTFNHGGSSPLVLGGSFTALSSAARLTGTQVTLGSGGTIFDTNGFNATIAAPMGGSQGFTKTGVGILSVGGVTSSFTGPVQVTAGVLRLIPQVVSLPADLKIMPLGDSITYGATALNGGYRAPLYDLLQPIAPNFHFIGDSTLNPGTLPAGQQNHAGHSSYSSPDIRNNLDGLDSTTFNTLGGADRNPNGGYWFPGGDGTNGTPNRAPIFPDVILLMVGANDIYRLTMNTTQAYASYTALMTKITSQRPNARVFMSKITPSSTNDGPAVAYNGVVQQVYDEFKAAGKKVTLVDMHTGFTGGTSDSLHPTPAGYQWMAERWRDALGSALGTEGPGNFRNAPLITVQPGATLTGSALVNQLDIRGTLSPGDGIGIVTATAATISGNYQCDLTVVTSDRLVVEGNLDLTNATLAIQPLETPAAALYVIASYSGNLSGGFGPVTGMPPGYQLVNDAAAKRLVIATPYAAWRIGRGLPDVSGAGTLDADSDGAADLMEFAIGGNPVNAGDRGFQRGSVETVGAGNALTFTILARSGAVFSATPDHAMTAAKDGISYRVEGSEDLTVWQREISEIPPASGLDVSPAGYEYHRFRASGSPESNPMGFIRLRVAEGGF
ncbi:MAG: GDSL-type esterase/lipase family protein [Luteolibacter sp.]